MGALIRIFYFCHFLYLDSVKSDDWDGGFSNKIEFCFLMDFYLALTE